jgi:hypothetical protein
MRALLPLIAGPIIGCSIENGFRERVGDPDPNSDATSSELVTDATDTLPPTEGGGGTVTDPVNSCSVADVPAAPLEQLDECLGDEPPVGTFSPVVLWERQTFSTLPGSASCMMQPIVCSLTDDDGDGDEDADDVPDVIMVTYSPGVLRALSGDDGHELWATSGSGTIQITGGAACGDLDNDGSVEVVAATAGGVEVFDHNGTSLWSSTACVGHMDGTSDAPGLADMDHDGEPEIIIGNCILDSDGDRVGAGAYGWGSSSNVGSAGFAVDLDLDGELEVVSGNAAYDVDGNTIWYNGERDGYPAVGNFDADSEGEIVVTGDARMRIEDSDGTVLCTASIPGASSSYGGPPTVADFDGDGDAEIGVAANSTYTVFENDCSLSWQFTGTTDPSSGNTASSVFDFEGDGVADVVYADEHWVWVFDGRDGTVKMQDANHTNNTWLEYPTIADINADGSADIAVCNTPGTWGRLTGVSVFQDADQSWRPGRRIWNQHGYSITNIEEDGSIPVYQEPNWLAYNNFRSGDLLPGEGYSGPDLVAKIEDVCSIECDRGNVTVSFSIGNQGYRDVTEDVAVDIWGETDRGVQLLTSITWTGTLVQGEQSASYAVELPGVPSPLYDIWVAVDGGDVPTTGVVDECHEDNNVAEWGAAICP